MVAQIRLPFSPQRQGFASRRPALQFGVVWRGFAPPRIQFFRPLWAAAPPRAGGRRVFGEAQPPRTPPRTVRFVRTMLSERNLSSWRAHPLSAYRDADF